MISKAKQFFPIAASLRTLIFMTESCGSNCPNTKLSPPLCALSDTFLFPIRSSCGNNVPCGILFDGSSCTSSGETLARATFPLWYYTYGLPWRLGGKESECTAISGSGRSLGEGNDNHSSIPAWTIPWRGPWQPTVHGVQRVRHDFHYTYSISQPGFLWLCSPQTHDWCLMPAHSNQLPDYLSNQPPINLQPDGNCGDWWLFRERVSPCRAPSAGGARRGIWGRQDPQDILNSIMTSLRLGLLFLE